MLDLKIHAKKLSHNCSNFLWQSIGTICLECLGVENKMKYKRSELNLCHSLFLISTSTSKGGGDKMRMDLVGRVYDVAKTFTGVSINFKN